MATAPMPPMDPQVSHPKLPMIIAIGLTAIIFGLGGYTIASMANSDTASDATVTTGSTSTATTSATPTTKATTTASSTTKTTETYTNSKYKFTLSHPSDWKVTETNTSTGAGVRFTKGSNSSSDPTLLFDVNPEGGGLQTPEYTYEITYKNNTLSIGSKKAGEDSEYSDVKKGAVYFDDPNANGVNIKINGNSYIILASNISNETDLAAILAIVSSFKLN
jgi:co-chaperonin GroES (HSP10)